eukprot:5876112-Prymnesium_polylepis.1
MRWEHVVAWVRDEELLQSAKAPADGLPWRRGFYRWYARYYRGPKGPLYVSGQGEPNAPPERFLADGNPCRPEHGLSAAHCRCAHTPAREPIAAFAS